MLNTLYSFGGLLVIFIIIHFIMDLFFQNNLEIINKSQNKLIRFKQSCIYTIGFVPLLVVCQLNILNFLTSVIILFISHYIIDTDILTYYWARYIRKPLEMDISNNTHPEDTLVSAIINKKSAFVNYSKTTNGKILCTFMDQFFHIIFLLPLVWMALN